MTRSDSIAELVAALAAAQKKFDPVLKDSTNPHYKSKYADMASVIRATQAALCENGLVIVQSLVTEVEKQQAGVTTMLAHKSGQFIESTYLLPALMQGGRFDAQSCGSAFTYSRRYAYQAAIGVAGEDDDGQAAVGTGSKEAAKGVAVTKLKAAAKGDESVSLIDWKEGLLALSGNGLAIVRAAATEEEKDSVNVKYDKTNNVYCIKVADGFKFADLCKKYGVEAKWAEA